MIYGEKEENNMKKLILLLIINLLLVGCGKDTDDTTNVTDDTSISVTDATTDSDKTTISQPDKLTGYGVYAGLDRVVNVDGDLEYLSNAFPFEYVGEDVRYHCTTNFYFTYENGYIRDSVECLVFLYFNGQYIDFSIEDSEYKTTHKLVAEKTIIGSEEQYAIDFDFSFKPYGIESGSTEKFYISVVPLHPLRVENNIETYDVKPVSVCCVKGNVMSQELSVDRKVITTSAIMPTIITGEELEGYKEELENLSKYGLDRYNDFLVKKENKIENILCICEESDNIDKTLTTIVICDNEIIKGYGDNHISSTDINENSAIVSEIDVSGLAKGKHTIFTITIMEDNIKDSFRIYRSNFVEIEIE